MSKILLPTRWREYGSRDLDLEWYDKQKSEWKFDIVKQILYFLYSYLCRKITWYPASRKYSAEADPLVPALKLSMKRTVFCSRGTVVPPDCRETKTNILNNCKVSYYMSWPLTVTNATRCFFMAACWQTSKINLTFSSKWLGFEFSSKNIFQLSSSEWSISDWEKVYLNFLLFSQYLKFP